MITAEKKRRSTLEESYFLSVVHLGDRSRDSHLDTELPGVSGVEA